MNAGSIGMLELQRNYRFWSLKREPSYHVANYIVSMERCRQL